MIPNTSFRIADILPEKEVWPVLRALALIRQDKTKGEAELRKLLRPHTEVGFGPEEARGVKMRRRLDIALGSLTRLEIAYQLKLDVPTLPPAETKVLEHLFSSEAFLRYVNYYLYFGIRFLAGRLAPGDHWLKLPSACLRERNSNERPFELATPPDIGYSPFRRLGETKPAQIKQHVQQKFERFVADAVSLDPARNWRAKDEVIQALDFLDGAPAAHGREPEGTAQAETTRFELWLRGLSPELREHERNRFENLAFGLFKWAVSRSDLYYSLPSIPRPSSRVVTHGRAQAVPHAEAERPLGGWRVDNPAAARQGLADMYWISSLFRAEVSAEAIVKYSRPNWLHLLRQNAALLSERQGGNSSNREVWQIQDALWKSEEVLRSVFDFTCELVQNALDVTSKKERQAYEQRRLDRPGTSMVGWRRVFDEELEEIERERCSREFLPPPALPPDPEPERKSGWSRRIRNGEHPPNLIGLAFSGGGIRSATFNLGVLQGLQRLDLLRKIDYLSTVSGGGFIGAWLIGNVYRTRHWLVTHMNWDQSIAHLRRYSNYLSPRTGVLSVDTWTMWASWSRNALLIQLTGAAWLFTLLSAALLMEGLFHRARTPTHVIQYGLPIADLIAGFCLIVLLVTLLHNLRHNRAVSGNAYGRRTLRSTGWLQFMAVAPAWVAAFLLSSLLWADAGDCSLLTEKLKGANAVYAISYSGILSAGILLRPWWLLLGLFFVGLCFTSFFTLTRFRQERGMPQTTQQPNPPWRRIWHSFWISSFSVMVFYLEICGIVRIFMAWGADSRFDWYAYVLGPPLVLAAFTISVVIFIGLSGRNSEEPIREWWTRFGTWMGVYGVGYLLLTGFAVFGPLWTLRLFHSTNSNHPALIATIKWGSVISWVGTVVSGLLAGKSSKTSGARSNSPGLEILANVAGLLFIVGAIFVAATVLYVLLFNIALDVPFSHLWDYWTSLDGITEARGNFGKFHFNWLWGVCAVAFLCGLLFSRYFEINIFGLNQFYRNRLVRCYLGATRWAPGYRQPQPFTKFDGKDDMKLGAVLDASDKASGEMHFRGPFPIFNCTLNLAGSSDLTLHTRHSASFTLTPIHCGADREKVGYAPTTGFADGVMLGQAVAISGAASPNMGYNTSPLVAFLLTMFNVRLGWWFPNPSRKLWNNPGLNFSLWYLVKELFGVADETSNYVNVSDGGHFENLGIYELVRRRCKVIIACDAECDESLQFGSLGNVVRLCETDFGAKIDINVNSIRRQQSGYSLGHCSVGTITYSNGSIGYLIYLKTSVIGDEEVGIAQYRSIHPSFPHETTADQFFSEDQFESYRQLGLHVVQHSFRSAQGTDHPVDIAQKLFDVLTPAGSSETFLKHIKTLDDIWERFRRDVNLRAFVDELEGIAPPQSGPVRLSPNEILIGLEIIQLMENVFLDLRLDDFWDHPDNRGWAVLFMRWAGSRKLREIWEKWRSTFGIRFEHFCDKRLGLPHGKYPVRV
jgi:hypothetical protein